MKHDSQTRLAVSGGRASRGLRLVVLGEKAGGRAIEDGH